MAEIQDADPRARRLAVLLVVCGALAGLAGLWLVEYLQPAVEAWIIRDPERMWARVRLFFGAAALVVALPAFGVAGYLWRLGATVVRADRFPPPGLPLIRDTVVLRGAPARRRGRLVQAVAAFLAAAVLALTALLWWLLALLESGAG